MPVVRHTGLETGEEPEVLKGLQGLRSLVAVVRFGGVRAAAGRLHYDPSRVRAHIRGLEQDLRVRLLRRTESGDRVLTHEGQQLMPQMEQALDAVDEVEAKAAELTDG